MAQKISEKLLAGLPVTSYLDYRSYLFDIYTELKKDRSPFSYLQYAQDLGFSPTNVIRLVIAGKRSLSAKSAQTIAKTLAFSPVDKKYFITLVGYNDAKGASLRRQKFNDLLNIKHQSLSESKDRGAVDYFSHWSRPVLRELLRLTKNNHQEPNVDAIRSMLYPDLRVPKIEETLQFLEAHDYVTRDHEGKLQTKDEGSIMLPADATAGHLSVLSYHQQMLQIAQECLIKVPSSEREFNALTLCVSEKNIEALRTRIRQFCAEIMQLEAKNQTRSQVAQLNIQLFAITKPIRSAS